MYRENYGDMTMTSLEKLGANIKSLRCAFGETQEQLGEAIYVEKNTISYYEKGQREPKKETLAAIAQHFMVSTEELLHCDLTAIDKIRVDNTAFWKSIDIIVPIAVSEKALSDEHFAKAFRMHKSFYDQLRRISLDGIDNVDICFEEYEKACENDDSAVEAAANVIGLWFLTLFMLNTPKVLEAKPAALRQLAKQDKNARKILENTDPSFAEEAEAILASIDDDEAKEMVDERLTAVKKSAEWSDLADYYLALQYVWNIVDNDLEWAFNRRIGYEMLNAFVSVKNVYAARFLKFNIEALT